MNNNNRFTLFTGNLKLQFSPDGVNVMLRQCTA